MIYRGKSTYTLEGLRTFQRAAARIRGRRQYLISRGSYYIAGVLFACMAVFALVQLPSSDGATRFWNLVILILGAWMAVQMLITAVTYFDYFARRAMRSIPADAHEIFFSFEDDHVVVGNRTKTYSFRYGDMVDTVYETERYFLLFIGWRNGYILEKSGIEGGDVDGLRAFLEEKLNQPVVWMDMDEKQEARHGA